MGVLGLTRVVLENGLFSVHPLRPKSEVAPSTSATNAVVDGSSIAHCIYERVFKKYPSGGVYRDYARACKIFFQQLAVRANLNIVAVVFDGAHCIPEKLKTVRARRFNEPLGVEESLSMGLRAETRVCFAPPMLVPVTISVCRYDLELNVIVAEQDADPLLVSLASVNDAILVSADSDFMLFPEVKATLLPNSVVASFLSKNYQGIDEDNENSDLWDFYVNKRFHQCNQDGQMILVRASRIASYFGGPSDWAPLLACALGNDNISTFELNQRFYSETDFKYREELIAREIQNASEKTQYLETGIKHFVEACCPDDSLHDEWIMRFINEVSKYTVKPLREIDSGRKMVHSQGLLQDMVLFGGMACKSVTGDPDCIDPWQCGQALRQQAYLMHTDWDFFAEMRWSSLKKKHFLHSIRRNVVVDASGVHRNCDTLALPGEEKNWKKNVYFRVAHKKIDRVKEIVQGNILTLVVDPCVRFLNANNLRYGNVSMDNILMCVALRQMLLCNELSQAAIVAAVLGHFTPITQRAPMMSNRILRHAHVVSVYEATIYSASMALCVEIRAGDFADGVSIFNWFPQAETAVYCLVTENSQKGVSLDTMSLIIESVKALSFESHVQKSAIAVFRAVLCDGKDMHLLKLVD